MEIKFKKSLLIFFVLFFLLEAGVVLALEVEYPSMPGAEPPQVFLEKIEKGEIPKEKALPLFIKYFLSLALVVSVSICLLILIIGGLRYVTSTGNPASMAEAIKQISQAGLGLIVILSSYLILTAINPDLSILRLPSWEKVPPSHIAESISGEKGFVYFQTSIGKIIEGVALDLEAHEKFEGTNNIDYLEGSEKYLANKENDEEVIGIMEKAEKARDESENLKKLSQELKELTDECLCGKSSCDSVNCGNGCCCKATGCSQMNTCSKPCGCSIISLLPCNLAAACPERHCDLKAISKKIVEIEQSMANLKIQQKQVFTAQLPLLSDYLKLKKAGLMITLPGQVLDYGSFFKERSLIEQAYQEKVEVDTFSVWPEPMIEVEGGGAVFDPTSIYFDKKIYENKMVIKESSRVEPLLVQSNLSPEDLNKIMTENAQEVLGQYSPEDFLPSSEEMNDITQEIINQVSSELSQEISEALTDTLIGELIATIVAEAGAGAGASAGISAELGNQIGYIIAEEMPAELNILFTAEISIDLPNILANLNIDSSLTLGDLLLDNLPSGTTIQNIDGLDIILSGDLVNLVPNLDALLNLNLSNFIPEGQLPGNLLNATLADIFPSDIINLLYGNLGNLLPSEITNFLNTDLGDFLPSQFTELINTPISGFLPSQINELLNLDLSNLLSNVLPSEIGSLLSTNLIDLIPGDLANILSMNIGELLPGDLMDLVYTTLGELLGIDLDEFFPDFLLNLPDNLNFHFEGTSEGGTDYNIDINITGLLNIFDLIPGLNTILSQLLDIYNQINDLLDTSLANFIPQEIFDLFNMSLADFLPDKITDALSLSLGEIILPEEINNILATNLKELLPEGITDALSLTMTDLLPENIQNLLDTSLMDELPFEISDILNTNIIDQLPDNISGLLNTSLADKLNLPSIDLKEILLENLAKENPELYKLLTTSLKNNISSEELAILEGTLAVNISPAGKNIFTSKLKNELPSSLLSVSLETGELSNKIGEKLEEKLSIILNKELKNKLSSEQIGQFSLNLFQRGIVQNKVDEVFSENLPVIVKAVNKKSSQMISEELSKKLAEKIGEKISDKTSEQISKKVSADLEKIISPVMLKMLEQGMILNFPHDLRTLDELKDYE